mmetsp:Transcript_7167/g.8145  ORF Transcript_7167/g.8145 Transcript_7167/m.8145 type:complete len:101 (+) Transcript_7167:349-651(+)
MLIFANSLTSQIVSVQDEKMKINALKAKSVNGSLQSQIDAEFVVLESISNEYVYYLRIMMALSVLSSANLFRNFELKIYTKLKSLTVPHSRVIVMNMLSF